MASTEELRKIIAEVVGDSGVPHDGAALGRHAPDQPKLLEQLQRGVDGRQRDAGHLRADVAEDRLGGHVAVELAQRAGEREPLRRDTQPARAQRVGQSCVDGLNHDTNVAQANGNPDPVVALNDL